MLYKNIASDKIIKLGVLIFLFTTFISFINPSKAYAAYDGGRIIDNGIFLNSRSMALSEIQSFLSAQGGGLASRSFKLDCYGANSLERQWYTAVNAPCDQTVSSASIIYYAAQIYGINPQVILATLQKEQSLVTSPNPTDWQINHAMGYGCPTSGSCSTSNFFAQIDSGTWVLRYHYERANGNNTWWNNGGYTCGSPSIYYNPGLVPGRNVTFIDEDGVAYRTLYIANAATASLYCYTPHTFNNPPTYGTIGRYYSGSYNFVLSFERWFGSTQTSAAFKSSSSPSIYLSINGYKLVVSQMATLQDHGISPDSIQIVSQTIADSIPAPPVESGISSTLGHLVKTTSDTDADGGSIYLISVGKRYQIKSMDQFFEFGFSESNISYLPYEYVMKFDNGGLLNNFITTPQNAVFEVTANTKREIFEYNTFTQRNPSGGSTRLSYYLADALPSGKPLSNRPIMIKYANSSLVYLYNDETYYPINTYDAFSCWGLNTGRIPLYSPIKNEYIQAVAPSNEISCVVKGPSPNTTHIVSSGQRLSVPDSYGLFTNKPYIDNIYALSNQINNSGKTLKQYVKSNDSAAIWLIESGKKRVIPSYNSFRKLIPDGSNFDTINTSVINSIDSGPIKLANGAIVKSNASSAVYGIFNDQRILYGYNEFVGFKNDWLQLETYSESNLDSAYPYLGSVFNKYFVSSNKVYLLDPNGCYIIPDDQLNDYSISKATLNSAQIYDTSVLWNTNLNTCLTSNRFIKESGTSLVYLIYNGKKLPIKTWVKLQQLSGSTTPYVMTSSKDFLNSFQIGPSIN